MIRLLFRIGEHDSSKPTGANNLLQGPGKPANMDLPELNDVQKINNFTCQPFRLLQRALGIVVVTEGSLIHGRHALIWVQILTRFLPDLGQILIRCWPDFDQILNIFWPDVDQIMRNTVIQYYWNGKYSFTLPFSILILVNTSQNRGTLCIKNPMYKKNP